MKNESVKFKHQIPKSSTQSVISDFEVDASPTPNGYQFTSFTQAQTISARLMKNSVYNEQNMMYNTPKCGNVPYEAIVSYSPYTKMKDEVLSKSPISRVNQPFGIKVQPVSFTDACNNELSYTEQSIKRIKKMEQFLQEAKSSSSNGFLSSEEGPRSGMSIEQDENQLDRKVSTMLKELRIIRKKMQYFHAFDGNYAQTNSGVNFIPLQTSQGILLNMGTHLTRLDLLGESFYEYEIAYNPDKSSKYKSMCMVGSDTIYAGTNNGGLFSFNQHQDNYFALKGTESIRSMVEYMTYHDDKLFITTSKNQVMILDKNMSLIESIQLTNQNQIQPRSVQQSPLMPLQKQGSAFDSPLANAMNLELRETNLDAFQLDMQCEDQSPDTPLFQHMTSTNISTAGSNFIYSNNNGFVLFDIRQTQLPLFVYSKQDTIKTIFNPSQSKIISVSHLGSRVFNLNDLSDSYEKQFISTPTDIIVSNTTQEVLTLHVSQSQSMIQIHNDKLKYIDEIQANLILDKLLMDHKDEILYGIGAYSLRTWNFFNPGDSQVIKKEVKNQLNI